jgi:hypothetical protein
MVLNGVLSVIFIGIFVAVTLVPVDQQLVLTRIGSTFLAVVYIFTAMVTTR